MEVEGRMGIEWCAYSPVESAGSVEELEVEWAGCLAVNLPRGFGWHCHFVESGSTDVSAGEWGMCHRIVIDFLMFVR